MTGWPWLTGHLQIGILLTSAASDGSTVRGGTDSLRLMTAKELIGNIHKTEHRPKIALEFQPSQTPASLVLNDDYFHKKGCHPKPLFVHPDILSLAKLSRDQLILFGET